MLATRNFGDWHTFQACTERTYVQAVEDHGALLTNLLSSALEAYLLTSYLLTVVGEVPWSSVHICFNVTLQFQCKVIGGYSRVPEYYYLISYSNQMKPIY